MEFFPKWVWPMGYPKVMGFGVDLLGNRLGNSKHLWGIGRYGLSGVWVKRVTTGVDFGLNQVGPV